MTSTLVAEENGQKILAIYKHFNSEIGHALRSNNFLAVGRNRNWNAHELQSGLEFAVDKGWLEKAPDGWLTLTKAGYDEM